MALGRRGLDYFRTQERISSAAGSSDSAGRTSRHHQRCAAGIRATKSKVCKVTYISHNIHEAAALAAVAESSEAQSAEGTSGASSLRICILGKPAARPNCHGERILALRSPRLRQCQD